MIQRGVIAFIVILLANSCCTISNAFSTTRDRTRIALFMCNDNNDKDNNNVSSPSHDSMQSNYSLHHTGFTRKSFLKSFVASTIFTHGYYYDSKEALAQEEGFESIAARASQMAKAAEKQGDSTTTTTQSSSSTTDARTIYDFSLPVAGKDVPLFDLIQQEFYDETINEKDEGKSLSSSTVQRDARVKAILVVNIKQDDPVARKNIPELISLAAKFGRSGDFAVICSPTDQGYFEPDTSTLIRLKLASEYGYGINPSTIITDKVNILGTGAHPFWRWIEGSCRAPSGLGRIQGNFEKFLVDGRTGKPLRRYPRQYQPFDIAEDIDAIIKGKSLPPAGANWREEWRSSDKDAEKDVYRFQKGLNFYDQ